MKFRLALIAIALMTSGCGTAITVVRGDSVASRNLGKIKSYCRSIPRVYSGVSYDFCTLYGPPPPQYSPLANLLVPGYVTDLVLSALADSVVLPYTIYRQARDGNIVVGPSRNWERPDQRVSEGEK